MKQQHVLYAIIGVLVGILMGMFISSYAVNNNSYGMMRMMGFRSNGSPRAMMGNADSIDQHFIEQMIPHHEDAVTYTCPHKLDHMLSLKYGEQKSTTYTYASI